MNRVSGGSGGWSGYAWRRTWVLVASFLRSGAYLAYADHQFPINALAPGRYLDLWGAAFRIALFWLGGVLIADRVMVPGDLSLISWTRDVPRGWASCLRRILTLLDAKTI